MESTIPPSQIKVLLRYMSLVLVIIFSINPSLEVNWISPKALHLRSALLHSCQMGRDHTVKRL